jgi:MtrB/PioB family decaheme-associated outer membrane protein
MRAKAAVRLVLAAAVVLAVASPASAQFTLGGWNIEGDVSAGWRFLPEEPSRTERAKWEEYRDFPESAMLGNLELRVFTPDEKYSVEFGGTKWGQLDQEFRLRGGRLGLWEFGFDWDQTPHLYSTDARFLATETSRGVYTLPNPRPPLATHNSAPLTDIEQRWDAARMFFKLTPTPDLDILAEYTRTRKHGDRPFSMAFGSPGNNFYQILDPIEQTVHDFRIKGTWARDQWQLQFSYALSIFQNDLNAVRADNPCSGAVAPAGCAAGDAGAAAPATGQTSLAPDNMAHTFTLGGGVNLPMRTRLTGNFSYSLQLQNEDFLPHTINPALASDPRLVLPQKSLNGNVQTILVNLGAVTRPIKDVTLSAKYRLFNMMDKSDEITFADLVLNDRTIAEGRFVGRFDYQRQNADADARWQVMPKLALTLGGGWERWDRNSHREVPVSDEPYAKAAVDATPFDWLLARLTYRAGFRRISNYNTRAHSEHAVAEADEAAVLQGQSILLRKFDEADRNLQKVDLFLQITPLDTLTITPTGSYSWTNYLDSNPVDPAGAGQRSPFLGVQEATAWTAGMDVTWAPLERMSFSAGYMHESNFQKMESRSRPVVGVNALDFSDFDWLSDITDTIDTLYAGVKLSVIPKVLDFAFNASYAYALGNTRTRNPTAPVSGTPAQDTTARAQRFPAFTDELLRLEATVSYHFLKQWTARVGYVFESFHKNDWRTDQLNPFIPGVSSVFLGNDLQNYTAQIVGATIGYRFK